MPATTYEEIKASHELPSPTGVALQILELAQDEDSTVEQIAAVVESDPAIVSRLLKLVNSPLAGMPRQIASIQRTVALLGVNTVTSLALSFSLVSNHRQGKCPTFDYELFWSDSVVRAASFPYERDGFRRWLKSIRRHKSDKAFLRKRKPSMRPIL